MSKTLDQLVEATFGSQTFTILQLQAQLEAAHEKYSALIAAHEKNAALQADIAALQAELAALKQPAPEG